MLELTYILIPEVFPSCTLDFVNGNGIDDILSLLQNRELPRV